MDWSVSPVSGVPMSNPARAPATFRYSACPVVTQFYRLTIQLECAFGESVLVEHQRMRQCEYE
jgi:hypothetical protein